MNIFWLTEVRQEIVIFVTFDPRDPPGPRREGRVNIRMQLQAPGSRLRTPNGAFKIGPKAYH